MRRSSLTTALRSLRNYLNPAFTEDPRLLEQLAHRVREGRLIIMYDAFRPAFAERVHSSLDTCTTWELHADYSQPFFHYRHHNLYDERRFPADLEWCDGILQSPETKKFVEFLSGRDCSGRGQFSASWYRPGDYSLPHTDLVGTGTDECRQVAMVWHLTKTWQADWGGHFYWCPTLRYVPPSFNTVLLFTVSRHSAHFVTTVSPHAEGKRLAVSGWWTGSGEPSRQPEAAPTLDPLLPHIEVV